MTDIVIPYKITRSTDELRYCLRSIEANLIGVGNVFIIGEVLEWVKGVSYVLFSDVNDSRYYERNIYNKLACACNSPQISDKFLRVDDDHFLLQKFHAGYFPYYYSTITGGNEVYRRQVENTGTPRKYFDVHCPILFDKEKFIPAFKSYDWSKPYGYLIKTIYCLENNIEGEFMEDCVLRSPGLLPPHDRKWFSTKEKAFDRDMKNYLESLFPNKSKYEAD